MLRYNTFPNVHTFKVKSTSIPAQIIGPAHNLKTLWFQFLKCRDSLDFTLLTTENKRSSWKLGLPQTKGMRTHLVFRPFHKP